MWWEAGPCHYCMWADSFLFIFLYIILAYQDEDESKRIYKDPVSNFNLSFFFQHNLKNPGEIFEGVVSLAIKVVPLQWVCDSQVWKEGYPSQSESCKVKKKTERTLGKANLTGKEKDHSIYLYYIYTQSLCLQFTYLFT